MTYWWVNHKKTARQELEGGYVWSPKCERNGNRSQYYEYMREMRPGDLVVSFANGKIGHYGTVSGFPLSAPKPSEFGKAGENWSSDGWLVAIAWTKSSNAFRPKDNITGIRAFLPDRYSPIQDSGNGNQKAYLTKISEPLFRQLQELGGFDLKEGGISQNLSDASEIIEDIELQIQQNLLSSESTDCTEIEALIKARKGQGKFRRNVEQLESKCRVSGLRDKRLLVASHIKPWRLCETAGERLDGANGLLLAPHIDRLFDLGLITFRQDGRIIVSTTLDPEAIQCLGLFCAIVDGVEPFADAQQNYLAYHRDYVFIG